LTGAPYQWHARTALFSSHDTVLLADFLGSGPTARLTYDLQLYDLDTLMSRLRAHPLSPLVVDAGATVDTSASALLRTALGMDVGAGVDLGSSGPPSLTSDSTDDGSPRPSAARRRAHRRSAASRNTAHEYTCPAPVSAFPADSRTYKPRGGGHAGQALKVLRPRRRKHLQPPARTRSIGGPRRRPCLAERLEQRAGPRAPRNVAERRCHRKGAHERRCGPERGRRQRISGPRRKAAQRGRRATVAAGEREVEEG